MAPEGGNDPFVPSLRHPLGDFCGNGFSCISLWRRPPTRSAMPCDYRTSVLSRRCAVSDNSQKYALECLRMAADFAQLANEVHDRLLDTQFLASDVHNRALEIHLLGMAKLWTARAEGGPDALPDQEIN